MSKNNLQAEDNKTAVGREIFRQIKIHLSKSGASMTAEKFPPDFPISRRTCYNIANGMWTPEILSKLPFPIRVGYTVEFPAE